MKTERININQITSKAYQPLFDLHHYLKNSTLSPAEFLLIEIRASQINGCAYCLQMHIKDAIDNGEKQYRIHALPVWEESPFFTEDEKIILQMTEQITMISQQGLSDELYQIAMDHFDATKVADIIMAICAINTWNRIGRATLMTPEASQS
ncbi:carboxymuconolactone decarboxylase family protein [Aquimarina spongiae]|uniref:Alkylhydroperoxidase AhpD family core domain-containing protein n=1 Tax=Aquimarina spongiae TaxID=570521 RepID=A0A1M6H4F9_9FLAO|nr:carboxymuconolactone decarboxylase family protein [Aquimarina spongiae]SHJ17111.1 alkylhydroperoxidase AhpD family core domain-containing protein [Aquimarina spongiae]